MMATFETGDAWLLKRNWFNQTAITTGATTATADNNDNNNSPVQTIYLQYGYYIG